MDSQQNAYNFTKNMNAWSFTIHSKYSDQVNFKYCTSLFSDIEPFYYQKRKDDKNSCDKFGAVVIRKSAKA